MSLLYDVVVVGAGPAGSAAARYAAAGGAHTLLLDRRREVGVPVRCGEFLPTVEELRLMFPRAGDLAELAPGLGAREPHRVRFLRVFSPAGREYRVRLDGLVVDRGAFDRAMAGAAVASGAALRTGVRVTGVKEGAVLTSEGEIHARVIVGADGPHSVVARWGGLGPPGETALGVQYVLRGVACREDAVEMHFGSLAPGGYAWVIPKGDGVANVGLGLRPATSGALARRLLDEFVGLLERRSGRRTERLALAAKMIPVGGPRRRTALRNVLLAGDAAGQVMASNGGGVPTAAICGRIAGEVAARHVGPEVGTTGGPAWTSGNAREGVPLSLYERLWRGAAGRELRSALFTRRAFDLASRLGPVPEIACGLAGAEGMRSLLMCAPWCSAIPAALRGRGSSGPAGRSRPHLDVPA